MDDALFVDTRSLRDHVSIIQEEQKTARQLYQSVSLLRDVCDPSQEPNVRRALSRIQDLITYFERMEEGFEQMEQEAFQVHDSIASMLREDTDRVIETQHNLML